MNVFSTRLRKLRAEWSLTQDELAPKLGISRSTLGMYETGKREPDFETLETIADFFNVDMNYLIGHSDDPIDYENHYVDSPTWWEGTNEEWVKYQKVLDKDREEDSSRPGRDILQHEAFKKARDIDAMAENSEDEDVLLISRLAKDMKPENRKKLIEMAKIMFAEDFDD